MRGDRGDIEGVGERVVRGCEKGYEICPWRVNDTCK
jgi:hypothetical protein